MEEESRNKKVSTGNSVRIASVCRAGKHAFISVSRASTRVGLQHQT